MKGGVNYYYATNELGTVRGLFDAAGVVNEYRYEPFGQPSVLAEGVESPYRFTGRAWDTDPELYYYRARYYDPDLGRFISEDPIGLAGGINPYVYVGNNPINARDPSGLGECWRTVTGTYVCESVGVTVEGPAEEENTSGDTGAGDQFPTVPGRDGGLPAAPPDPDEDENQSGLNLAGCSMASGTFSVMVVSDAAVALSGARLIVATAKFAGNTLASFVATSLRVSAQTSAARSAAVSGQVLVNEAAPNFGGVTASGVPVAGAASASSGDFSWSSFLPFTGHGNRWNSVASECRSVSNAVVEGLGG